MSQAQRIQGSKTVADVERQVNAALERINGQIGEAGGTGGVSQAEFAALQAQVTQNTAIAGSDLNNGGTGNPAPTPATTTVTTGEGITGDGGQSPISLAVPVAESDGGTGLIQTGVQQIITLGTIIAAGTAQAQPALALAGVTDSSAAMWSLPNAPDATWQTGIFVILVCTTDTITPWLVNPTAGGITPISQLVNIKAIL